MALFHAPAKDFGMRAKAGMCVLIAAMAVTAAPASAHHSQAMFDGARTVTVTGVVKEVRWANPHVWVDLLVPDARGELVVWGLEGTTPSQLQRRGWRRDSLAAGDRITVTAVHPLRSGQPGGTLGVVTRADGTVVGNARGGL